MEVDIATQDENSSGRQGQPSYGQQPYGEALASDALASGSPAKKGRPFLKILIAVVALLSLVASVVSWVSTILHDPASTVVNQYYSAIKKQDYATAFGYVGGAKSLNGEAYTQPLFTGAGQDIDTAKGTVHDYSITSSTYSKRQFGTGKFPLNKATYVVDTADITVSITRNGPDYTVNLQLQQQGNAWRIINLDGI